MQNGGRVSEPRAEVEQRHGRLSFYSSTPIRRPGANSLVKTHYRPDTVGGIESRCQRYLRRPVVSKTDINTGIVNGLQKEFCIIHAPPRLQPAAADYSLKWRGIRRISVCSPVLRVAIPKGIRGRLNQKSNLKYQRHNSKIKDGFFCSLKRFKLS